MPATIYYNPACETSRNALQFLRAAGIEPTIVEYLRQPPTRDELTTLIREAGLSVRGALRAKEPLAAELELLDAARTDDELLDAMLANPVLINRPFVVTGRGTRLCRPSETVLELLK